MSNNLTCHRALRAGEWAGPAQETVTLDHDARLIRRRLLRCDSGREVLVDLPQTVGLDPGDALALAEGGVVEVRGAVEDLVAVSGHDLARAAWHIGNRHTPCQIEEGRLVIARDHVIEAMLRQLGATLTEIRAPFAPEGGAYGHGRTMGHDHDHDREHGHEHGHGQVHGQVHGHGHDHPHGVHHGRAVHHHVSHRHEPEDEAPAEES